MGLSEIEAPSMRSAHSLLACPACCVTCHGFTLAVSGAPHTPRAFLSERRTASFAMGMGARGNKQVNPLAKAGAGAARVVSASTSSVVEIFSSHLSCADSAAAKRLLGSAGVEFTEHDCSSSEHVECALMSIMVVKCSSGSRTSTFRCSDVPQLATDGTLSA